MNINQAIYNFVELTLDSRSEHTARAYSTGLRAFAQYTPNCGDSPTDALGTDPIKGFMKSMKNKKLAPATEQVYIVAIRRFYSYLVAEELLEINMEKVKLTIQARTRKIPVRLIKFPKDEIEQTILHALELKDIETNDKHERLRNLRDAAMILTLADTGLRIGALCGILIEDMNWSKKRASVVGKGNKERVVRFSDRAIKAIKLYLKARKKMDNATANPDKLPLFSQHNRESRDQVLPISSETGRNIISKRSFQALGRKSSVTPHKFRHYFVSNVYNASGGNIRLAQELAGHADIQVTKRYAHLDDKDLDQEYNEIFKEKKGNEDG